MDNKSKAVVARAQQGERPRHVRPVWRRKQFRQDAMRLQFAPPGSGNKALALHTRLTSTPDGKTHACLRRSRTQRTKDA